MAKMTDEQRLEFIHKWVRAVPTDRIGLCKAAGISPQLPYYWRASGKFPKELTTPAYKTVTAPAKTPVTEKAPIADKVEPRSESQRPYTVPERRIIKAEYDAARAMAKAGEADFRGINRAGQAIVAKYGKSVNSWLHKPNAFSDTNKPRRRFPLEFKQRAAREYDRSADKAATAKALGISQSNLQNWVKAGLAAAVTAASAKTTDGHLWSAEEKNRLLDAYAASGESQATFCANQGLSRNTLGYWLKLQADGQRQRGPGRPRKEEGERQARYQAPRDKKTEALVATMNGALAKANGHGTLAKANGHYHPPSKVIRSDDLMGALTETLKRLRARGTIITNMSTDAETGEVRVTTQTTETIVL